MQLQLLLTNYYIQCNASPEKYPTTIWGPTCDSVDKICETELPELNTGDWLYFDDIGAYSIAAKTTFNGFWEVASRYYILAEWL